MISVALTVLLSSAPPVYTPAEAVNDVLSSPLEYVGRAPWFGMARWESCVYRNQRVLVVDIYCAKSWPQAFSVIVFSPDRGRLKLYVETEAAVSELSRAQYDNELWKVESEPPPSKERLPVRLRLDMSFEELRDYEEARYQLYLPACYTVAGKARCHRTLDAVRASWAAAVEPFWKQPGKRWRHLVKKMRRLAGKHGT